FLALGCLSGLVAALLLLGAHLGPYRAALAGFGSRSVAAASAAGIAAAGLRVPRTAGLACLAAFGGFPAALRPLAEDHQNLADVLNGRGAGVRADGAHEVVALVLIVAVDFDLDQFVRLEAVVDFLQDGSAEAFGPDHDDRAQRMCTRFQRAALRGSEDLVH